MSIASPAKSQRKFQTGKRPERPLKEAREDVSGGKQAKTKHALFQKASFCERIDGMMDMRYAQIEIRN
jgi:hypothetical protein